MFRLGVGISASLFCLLFSSPFSFPGEIYRWTDEKGAVHFTDDPSKIPAQYQNQLEKRGVKEEVSKDRQGVATDVPKPSRRPGTPDAVQRQLDAVDRNIAAKKAIEEQILVLEGELKTLEERLGKIKDSPPVIVRQHFNERTKTYTPVYGPNPEIVTLQTRITNIKRRIAYLQEQLDKIKRSL